MAEPGVGDGLDFWSFIELAKERLAHRFGASAEVPTEILLTLNRASMVITYDLESAVHRSRGLTWASFRLLFVIWLAGPLEPKRAAELAGVTKAAVSNLAKVLIRDGLLTRQPSEDDGRSVQLGLTKRGRAQISELFDEQRLRERAWVDVLTPAEQRVLVLLLNKLIAGRGDFDIHWRA
jgi:MarR family transcriptional regulator, negative regulator of the multidrug operon emrRAB